MDKSDQSVALRHGKSRSGNAEKLYHWSYWPFLSLYVIKTEVNPIKPWPIKYMKNSKENITGETGLLLYMTLIMDLITTALDIVTAVLNLILRAQFMLIKQLQGHPCYRFSHQCTLFHKFCQYHSTHLMVNLFFSELSSNCVVCNSKNLNNFIG